MTTLQQCLELLRDQLGNCVLTQADQLEPYQRDWRGLRLGQAQAVVKPETAEQISALMRWANAHHEQGVCVVPVGGRTGLCGGALPLPIESGYHTVLLDLTRLNRIDPPDTLHGSIYAQAGATLAQVQAIAQAHGYLFPISLASEGSCTIGGNLATNAGGTAVLHYGMMRAQCLSLDVVLPNGEQIHVGAGLHKDNSGYDLKHLWIGAEGTLGVIVGATLKLYPQAASYSSVLIQSTNESQLLDIFVWLRQQTGSLLTTFEMFSARCLELLHETKQLSARFEPLLTTQTHSTCYALIELSVPAVVDKRVAANDLLIAALSPLIEQKKIESAIVAQTQADRNEFWQMREAIPLAQAQIFQVPGATSKKQAKHDVALPISGILPFLNRVRGQLKQALGSFDEIVFGHLGDGNLHYNIAQVSPDQIAQINQIVYDCAIACGGSISAEHGIGYIRREALATYLPSAQIDLMYAIKQVVDPHAIMNPNKIMPSRFDTQPSFKNDGWGLAQFRQAQREDSSDFSNIALIYLSKTDSSNHVAKQHLGQHNKACLVVAEYQSKGRGQHGKTWTSQPRQGLLCSLGLQINRADLSGLSLVIGLSLRQGLESYLIQQTLTSTETHTFKHALDEHLKLKWPNDLYYANQKLAGILIESHRHINQSPEVIIGFGLNLFESLMTNELHEMSDTNAAPATSVQAIQRNLNVFSPINPAKLWAELISAILKNIKQFETYGFSYFQSAFQMHLLWQNQPIFSIAQLADEPRIEGICRGVDSTGALILETDQGLRCLYSGSIRLDTKK
jgi:biotin-[acetyl-CoA-carboxylase] ligase BirA-like protein